MTGAAIGNQAAPGSHPTAPGTGSAAGAGFDPHSHIGDRSVNCCHPTTTDPRDAVTPQHNPDALRRSTQSSRQ